MTIVCAYYTANTAYERIINKLSRSLKQFDLPNQIVEYESRGTWELNCAIKPEFLLASLLKLREDIFYVDADATFEQAPDFDYFVGDFMYGRWNGEALSGSLFCANTDNTRLFLTEWVSQQKQNPEKWDQKVMGEVLKTAHYLDARPLDLRYVKIFDLMKNVNSPIVVHHQASRQFRHDLEWKGLDMNDFELPKGVRILADGTYYMPRSNRRIEKYMNDHLKKFGGPRERRWYPSLEGSKVQEVFTDMFKGKTCTIIGKGPSLDALTKEDITTDGPVICLNETGPIVEKLGLKNPLFVIQQDAHLADTCKPGKKTTKLLLSYFSQNCCKSFGNRFIYRPIELGLRDTSLSAQVAIEFARLWGCVDIKLIAFDACVNENTEYAKAIGYGPERNGKPERFLRHRKIIEGQLRRMPVEWIIPQQKIASSDDNTQPQSHSQPEHHEPENVPPQAD